MKWFFMSVWIFCAMQVQASAANLVKDTEQARQVAVKQQQQREQQFNQAEIALQAQRDNLALELNHLRQHNQTLAARFEDNETTLANQERSLVLASGAMGEVFSSLNASVQQLKPQLVKSLTMLDQPDAVLAINNLSLDKAQPNIEQLNAFAELLQQQLLSSGRSDTLDLSYLDHSGLVQHSEVRRIGNVALLSDQGYLTWDGQQAQLYPKQVPMDYDLAEFKTQPQWLNLDLSDGQVLHQLANNPSIWQRFEQGGIVAKVLAGLLIWGLLIALYRALVLQSLAKAIRHQLLHLDQPEDNPLGRILQVYKAEQSSHLEALELRLLEAISDERPQLEQGLSMLKLLAALAPMLGLLGTVTGMIETFQVISDFGHADPQLMAGGIATALVTTVLGLLAAIPLLFAHNRLSAQAERLRNILEKQSIGLVAEQAEQHRVALC